MIIGHIVRPLSYTADLLDTYLHTAEIIHSILPEDMDEIPQGFTQVGHVCKSITSSIYFQY